LWLCLVVVLWDNSCTFKWTRLALPKLRVDECFRGGQSTLLGCYKFWGIISSTLGGHHVFLLCATIFFNYELLVVIPLDKLKLEFRAFLFKTNMLYNGLKYWKRMVKSATIWSTCAYLYQVLKCSLWAYLNLWSLPNLLCAKFWDLLRMNVVLAFCLLWRVNSIII
jgi:hypothetical protein